MIMGKHFKLDRQRDMSQRLAGVLCCACGAVTNASRTGPKIHFKQVEQDQL